jgi:hypothetical protein
MPPVRGRLPRNRDHPRDEDDHIGPHAVGDQRGREPAIGLGNDDQMLTVSGRVDRLDDGVGVLT